MTHDRRFFLERFTAKPTGVGFFQIFRQQGGWSDSPCTSLFYKYAYSKNGVFSKFSERISNDHFLFLVIGRV